MNERSVLLLATNKSEYLTFAINCAASIRLHNPNLPVFIATNIQPDEKLPGIKFLPVEEDLAKLYIEAKLYMDSFLQTEETLFIDSDCLCFSDLTPIFEACRGMDVTVIGRTVPLEEYWTTPEWSAGYARNEYSIDKSIWFNGGFYYIKRSLLTKKIFERAREISVRYDEYGFQRIQNNWKNEEDLMSIAMIANKQHPVKDDGEFMSDFTTDRRPPVLNVLKGARLLRNPVPGSNNIRSWFPANYSPIILHFGGSNLKSYPYISQSTLLSLFKKGFSISIATLLVDLFIHFPYKTYHLIKRLIRSN